MTDYELGNRIYELRKAKGLSQKDLGSLLGVSNKAVSKWETGAALPKTETLIKLASVFDISAEELLNGKREKIETLDGMSENTKSFLLKHKIRSIESDESIKEYKSARGYLIALACIFTAAFAVILGIALLLKNAAIGNDYVQLDIQTEENMTVLDYIINSFLFSLVLSGIYTGIYRFVRLKNKSPALVAVLCFLFFITVFILVIAGIVLIPQTILSSVKAVKKYKHKEEACNDRE